MTRFDAVIFDWMMTLAHYPTPSEHVELAMRESGEPVQQAEIDRIVDAMDRARSLPEVRAAEAVEDTSALAHHRSEHRLYRAAGIGPALADRMYRLLGTPGFHPPYPDALPVLRRLKEAGLGIGVVSDIHVDLRVHADDFGFGDLIDAWALSYELGIQKPEPEIFRAALDQLGTEPARTLMVGDRASRDGAAADLGLPSLILPAPSTWSTRGLEAVVALAI